MALFSKSADILGINARNLLYLTKYNSNANKKLADDKIYSKHFMQARGIGTAKLYVALQSLQELRNFNPQSLPKSFVIKPNRGYGGEGIIAIKDRRGEKFIDVDDASYTWEDLCEHCMGILDGKYAISGLRDKIIFEERLLTHNYFIKYSEKGLPDVRIIVFKYVPVIAMLRLPTPESKGKANLHLGALGLGIDIGTGKTTFGVRYNKLIKKLPNGESVRSILIPDWNEVLLTASKTQHLTQIGYLAVDIALTKSGIKILELNVRAGLAIQISNQVLLRRRLEKLADIKIVSPTEGVKLGRALFTRSLKQEMTSSTKAHKPIIGLFEYVSVVNTQTGPILAKIDPHHEYSTLDSNLGLDPKSKLATIKILDKKIKIPFSFADLGETPYKAIISAKHLSDFLIDVTATPQPTSSKAYSETREEKILQNLDKKICSINDQINLLSRLKPTNLAEEQKNFFKHPDQSPHFIYHKPSLDTGYLRNELKKLPTQIDHPLLPLYIKKIAEINHKLSLVDHIGEPEVMQHAASIYGSVTEYQYNQAISFIKNEIFQKDTSKKLRIEEVIRKVNAYLAQHKLTAWKIKVLEEATSGMQVNKKNTIMINKKAKISENRLQALIAHEIETHIFRLENGRQQPYELLQHGTAGYLLTEEGLAIYNQRRLNLPLGDKHFSPALNTVAIFRGTNTSFAELFHHLLEAYDVDKERAWNTCVRVKRGLQDTSIHGTFTKDLLYFVGYQRIRQLVRDKGIDELKKLYIGKIGIEDLRYFSAKDKWPIKYFPEYR